MKAQYLFITRIYYVSVTRFCVPHNIKENSRAFCSKPTPVTQLLYMVNTVVAS